MAKFLHIQQFGKPLHYGPELQTMLIKLGFTLLSNGQTYQQFSQKANFKNFPSDAWLTDMFPVKPLVNIDALKDLDIGFSGVYLHKMRFSADLFRDYFGIKQLYYWYQDGLLIASNDQMAILACLPSTPEPDLLAIKNYLNDRCHLSPSTFFEGIYRVLPGERINFSFSGIEKSYFWPVKNIPFKDQNASSYIESLKHRIAHFSNHNKKIYVAINGGIHSASLASLLRKYLSKEIKGIFHTSNNSNPFYSNRAHAVAVVHDFDLIKTSEPTDILKDLQYLTALTTRPICPSTKSIALLRTVKKAQGGILFTGHGGEEMSQSFEFYKRTLVQKQDFDLLKSVLEKEHKLSGVKDNFELYFIRELYKLLAGSFFQKIAFILLIPQVRKPFIFRFIKIKLRSSDRNKRTPKTDRLGQDRPISSELNTTLEMLDTLGNQLKVQLAFPFLTKEEIRTQVLEKDDHLKISAAELLPDIFKDDKKDKESNSGEIEILRLIQQALPLFHDKHPIWQYIEKKEFENEISQSEELILSSEKVSKLLRKLYLGIWLNEFYT